MKSIEFSKSGNVVYTIDDEKREVVAKIKCDEYDPIYLFNSQLYKLIGGCGEGIVSEGDFFGHCRYSISSSYSGKAKCHPDDNFDIDFGKRLALLRAKNKYLSAMTKKIYDTFVWVSKLNDRTHNLYMKQYRQMIDNNIALNIALSEKGVNN